MTIAEGVGDDGRDALVNAIGTAIVASALDGDPLALVGTGPFVPVEYDQGSKLVLERNEDYEWGPEFAEHTGPAHLSELEIQFVPEAQVRIGAHQTGVLDFPFAWPMGSVRVRDGQAQGGVVAWLTRSGWSTSR